MVNLYTIKFSKQVEKDNIKLKNANLDKNCKNILNLMLENLFCYPPSYEKLTGELSGLYSRRINRQHRIVYEVDEEKKKFISLECGLIIIKFNIISLSTGILIRF